MTLYHVQRPRLRLPARPYRRPTLRVRLALLNCGLLASAAIVAVLLGRLLIDGALDASLNPANGASVKLGDGTTLSVAQLHGRISAAVGDCLVVCGAFGVLVAALAGLIGGYVIAGRTLRPVRQVTVLARRLSGDTIDQRIRYRGGDPEVAELAGTFDAMLDRLGGAFESQRRFVANASHELRTPLAVMRTEIDVTIGDPDADLAEYRRMARVVRDASIRANDLVSSLLLLARTEAQAGRRLVRKVPVELSLSVTTALSAVRVEAGRLNLGIETDLAPAAVVGDPGLLDRLAGNLIENAVRYNHLAGKLWARTGADETHAWLVVGNSGFEVEPRDVPGLFEPFRRGGRERTGSRGCGLGLSIVRAVCEAHGGTVSAEALPGGGLEVTVRLPAAATTPVLTGTASVR